MRYTLALVELVAVVMSTSCSKDRESHDRDPAAHNCFDRISSDICPVGSTLNVQATKWVGEGEVGFEAVRIGGKLAAEVVEGGCKFLCVPNSNCERALKITKTEVICEGHSSAHCGAGETRCIQDTLQKCNPYSGQWEQLPCPTGQGCDHPHDGPAACARLDRARDVGELTAGLTEQSPSQSRGGEYCAVGNDNKGLQQCFENERTCLLAIGDRKKITPPASCTARPEFAWCRWVKSLTMPTTAACYLSGEACENYAENISSGNQLIGRAVLAIYDDGDCAHTETSSVLAELMK